MRVVFVIDGFRFRLQVLVSPHLVMVIADNIPFIFLALLPVERLVPT